MIITLAHIEKAISNASFRALFPYLDHDFHKYMRNPGCSCKFRIFIEVARKKDKLAEYFREPVELDPELAALVNHKQEWTVVNCSIEDLEEMLNSLKPGGDKLFAVARYDNMVTVVIRDA